MNYKLKYLVSSASYVEDNVCKIFQWIIYINDDKTVAIKIRK